MLLMMMGAVVGIESAFRHTRSRTPRSSAFLCKESSYADTSRNAARLSILLIPIFLAYICAQRCGRGNQAQFLIERVGVMVQPCLEGEFFACFCDKNCSAGIR